MLRSAYEVDQPKRRDDFIFGQVQAEGTQMEDVRAQESEGRDQLPQRCDCVHPCSRSHEVLDLTISNEAMRI